MWTDREISFAEEVKNAEEAYKLISDLIDKAFAEAEGMLGKMEKKPAGSATQASILSVKGSKQDDVNCRIANKQMSSEYSPIPPESVMIRRFAVMGKTEEEKRTSTEEGLVCQISAQVSSVGQTSNRGAWECDLTMTVKPGDGATVNQLYINKKKVCENYFIN